MSLPSRERGLKCLYNHGLNRGKLVAPLAGAWIEIQKLQTQQVLGKVAPLAGAWIEIDSMEICHEAVKVAPLAGAWIEIDCST